MVYKYRQVEVLGGIAYLGIPFSIGIMSWESKMNEVKYIAKTPAFRAEMKSVFFEAMNKGYATKPVKGTIAELPGSKTIPYVRGPWEVIDAYIVTPLGSASGGMTIISYESVPVWMMQYMGEYDEDAIPCLKAALRTAYEAKQFFGGRGPERFVHGEYVYINVSLRNVWRRHNFGDFFAGREEINDGDGGGKRRGWHSYQGMMLL